MVKRNVKNDAQLSLFENNEPLPKTPLIESSPAHEPSVVEFIRAQFERNPEMTPDEYKRWIKILVQSSIRRMG
jgi:hypothetical protein